MKHEKNIFIQLPEKVKLEIEELALLKSFKSANDILDHNSTKNALKLLREVLEETIKEYESDKWFKNEAHLKDLDRIQESYDKEIRELNEVIQKKAAK